MQPILKEIFELVIAGQRNDMPDKVKQALEEGIEAEEILNQSLVGAMREVGDRFERGEYYVPEMLVAARAMQAGLAVLKPKLIESGVKAAGVVVIGTVKGDLHDIGKNLVAMMREGAGFDVVDLGNDVAPQAFAEAARERGADIVGMSALLTTTMSNMRATIEALEDMGIRGDLKVMVGGAPITPDYADKIGADGYAPDASRAVALARGWV
jgi:5-methyltetrahydrofolate--homocysteine methyltransferase